MKLNIPLIFGGLALLSVLLVVLFLVLDQPTAPEDPGGEIIFTPSPSVPLPSENDGTLTVALRDGTPISVPNFTLEDQPEGASAENGYEVAGSGDSAYHILYMPEDSYFLISLYEEPLGEVRRRAEAELRSTLRLSDAALCSLNAEVLTTIDVNEQYSGQNLGLSFCAGSVVLP